MSAPSGTLWGNIVTGSKSTRKGRIGIYAGVSDTNTQIIVNIQVWFWSMYSVSDTTNSYYYNAASTATTLIGSKPINHTVSTGSGWSTSNQTLLGSTSYTYNKGTSAITKYYSAKLTGIDSIGSGNVMTASTSIKVPALASYKVTYNANGGSNAPSAQVKWRGKTLKLSTNKPTRTGYTFAGWATSSNGKMEYEAGDNYTNDLAITLYAKWIANTYKVTYNANGGSNAPSAQVKTHGIALTLSSMEPTRTNYTFKGWGTSSTSTTVAYTTGSTYSNNASITLYAIWELSYTKPRINDVKVYRCNSDGKLNDSGNYFRASFTWKTDKPGSNINIEWMLHESTAVIGSASFTIAESTTIGSVLTDALGEGKIDPEKTYDVRIIVTDASDDSHIYKTIDPMIIPLDLLSTGKGVAIGKPATDSNLFDIAFPTKFNDSVRIEHGNNSESAFFKAERTDNIEGADTGSRAICFGVGEGGINRGLYDLTLDLGWEKNSETSDNPETYSRWIIYTDKDSSIKFGPSRGGAIYTNAVSDIVTPSTGWRIEAANYVRWGRVAQLSIAMSKIDDTVINAGNITNLQIATINSDKCPCFDTALSLTASGNLIGVYMDSSGNIKISATLSNITKGAWISFSGTYILKNGITG